MSKPKDKPLTPKQQIFVDCYDGSIKPAAKKAKLSYDYCRRMINQPHIKAAIRARQDNEVRPRNIATRQERQEFWTEVMDGKGNMKDRLKASELLGRSEADFTDNHIVDAKASLLDILAKAGAGK